MFVALDGMKSFMVAFGTNSCCIDDRDHIDRASWLDFIDNPVPR